MPRFGTPHAFLCICLIDFCAMSSLKEPNFETAVLYCIKCSKLYYDSCSNQIVCCNLFRAYQRNREVMTRNSHDHHFKVLLTNNYIKQNLRVRSMAVVMYNFVGWGFQISRSHWISLHFLYISRRLWQQCICFRGVGWTRNPFEYAHTPMVRSLHWLIHEFV